MPRFCTKCGTSNDDDAGFCGNCGAPLKVRVGATETSSPNTNPTIQTATPRNRRLILIGSAAVVALLGIAAGLTYFLGDEPPSNQAFSKAVSRYYGQPGAAVDELVCLANFNYAAEPANINAFDNDTHGLMEALVSAGIYNPAKQVQSGGFFSTTLYQYSHTEAGTKAVKGTRLCVASSINVTDIRFDPIVDTQQGKRTQVHFRYEPANPAPWVQGELSERVARYLNLAQERVLAVGLVNHKWTVLGPNATVFSTSGNSTGASISFTGKSILDRIFGIFGPSNPIFGTWRVSQVPLFGAVGNGVNVQYTFRDGETVVNGTAKKVRYDVKDNTVTVWEDGQATGTVFRVIDRDHIGLTTLAGEVKFERVKD